MIKLMKYVESLNDDDFEVAFELIQKLYGAMLGEIENRVNERVEYAEMQMKMKEEKQ